jgi:hypothetical protein
MGGVFVFKQPPPGFITEYFGGGGKGGTSTSTVTIPPEVLARYNAVNARAENVAKDSFQKYGGEFVAGLSDTQKAGIQGTTAAAGQAQPYFDAATGLTASGAKDVGALTQEQIGYYQNPYTQAVVDPTLRALEQQQGQQRSQQQTQAIKSGGMNAGRSAVERALLSGQQGLAMSQAIAPLYSQGYDKASALATNQQDVVAKDLARRMQAGQQIAGLGTGAQTAALQGSQAQMAAGQVEQQTKQAGDTAEYQQFLQERGYPYQQAQFLANIAMGTGALSGSTTTSTQPGGFFSDKRLKEDVKEIGKTNDGQPIYSYKYKGDDRTQIGLMAQDVEKKHPEAVGVMGGYKTVDYKKATEDAERPHKDMGGGLMPNNFDTSSMGGAVMPDSSGEGFMRGGYVGGGLVGNDDWSQIIAANKAALGVYGGAQPLGGGNPGAMGGLNIPTSMATPKLVTASAPSQQRPSGLSSAMQTGKDIPSTYKMGKEGLIGSAKTTADPEGSAGLWGGQGKMDGQNIFSKAKEFFAANGGLIVPRHAYADGGETDNEVAPYDPAETMRGEDPMKDVLASGNKKYEMLKPAGGGGGGGGSSPFGDIVNIAKTAATFASMSDARVKDNIRPVGKTFDGQNIYSYNIGEGPTQMGLMAQEVLDRKPEAVGQRAGLLTVDYDRATEDAQPYASGGLVPRHAYATQGAVDDVTGQATEVPVEQPPVDDRIDRTLGALERIESGGKSDIVGPASRKGDRPYGLYQVMGANIPSWTEEALGRRMTPEEFRLDAKAQKDTARHRVGLYMNQYDDPRQAASMWFTGKPIEKAGNVADVLGTTNPKYLSMFDRYYGGQDLAPDGRQATGLKPPADIGRTPSGGEGKKSLGDTLTSEGFVVPALGFLGSMLASDKRNLGQALGEGIMGGVGAYQSQRKMAAELPKIEAATELEKARTGEVQQTTKNLRSGMYVVSFNALGELQLYDKENPTSPPIKLTDELGKPLPGKEGLVEEAKKMAGGSGAPSGQYVSNPTKLVEKPSDVNKWTPTLSMPGNYVPANISQSLKVNPATGKPQESSIQMTKQAQDRVNGMEAKASSAQDARLELTKLIQQFDAIPQGGWTEFGPGNAKRMELLGRVNSALGVLNADKIDVSSQAFNEAAKKGTFGLGFKVANSVGTREPGYVVNQAIQSQPGTEMSKKGIDIVTSAMLAQNDYDQDKAKFFRDYVSRFHTLEGADGAFEHYNPVQMYANRGLVNSIPPTDRDNLRNYVSQNQSQWPGAVANVVRDFEKTHGLGTAKLVMGGK